MTQREKAERLLALHQPGNPLLLVNAWDAASARVVVHAGAPAVATSSAAASFGLGYPDGQRISRGEMLGAVGIIARAVDVPVTADMEAGYGDQPEDAADTAQGVVQAGAVGLNMEDTTGFGFLLAIDQATAKVAAVRAVADETGVPLVLNARVDTYLSRVGHDDTQLAETIERGRAYLEAGADCVFVPGVTDSHLIAAIVEGIEGNVSVLASHQNTVADLARAGVARISLGSGPYRAALSHTLKLADEVYSMGTFAMLADSVISHDDAQRLMGG
jgi:2-methylisocitrate lyase-like PEP mutase family enzyme